MITNSSNEGYSNYQEEYDIFFATASTDLVSFVERTIDFLLKYEQVKMRRTVFGAGI